MRSVNQKFSNVPNVEIPRSTFNRDHQLKTTFDAGSKLIPIFVDEVLPGDTFDLALTGFARMATPLYPIMDSLVMETFFFFVPNRLVWDNWKKHQGEQVDPGDSIDYTVPVIDDLSNAANESIWDYLGLPTKVAAVYEFNALIPRSINLIWNEWFRDQNLQDSITVNKDDGPDSEADYDIDFIPRGKRHDYFTSALPFLQKGDAVLMSLGTSADIISDTTTNEQPTFQAGVGGTSYFSKQGSVNQVQWAAGATADSGGLSWDDPKLVADLSTAVGPTVNELRQAVQVQRLLEKDARAGTRYTEIIKSHFGVTSPDGRLQRPEYLGGGRTPVNISPVVGTAATNQGQLAAFGVAAFQNHGFIKSFTEHGHVIGFVNVRSADLTYQEGIDRMWTRQTRYDFYMPTLAHLGEQAIKNKEIYIDATTIGSGVAEETFGYQERFAEYRYKPSRITGKFRSNDTASLDPWHLGIEFGSTPTLDATFIKDNPPVDRVIAVPSEPHFIYDSFVRLRCTRPMPMYAIPGLIDHF